MTYVNALSELEDVRDGEKPWCDLVFDVTHCEIAEREEAGGPVRWIVGQAMAELNGEVIGFGFEIPAGEWWQRIEIPMPGAPVLHVSQINLVSTGAPTDGLLHCYENWFAEPVFVAGANALPEVSNSPRVSKSRAVERVTGAAVSLNGVTDPFQGPMPCKLTFEADKSDAQSRDPGMPEADFFGAELYFNIDLTAKKAWLREKDPEYRQYLLGFLAGRWRTVPEVALQHI